MEGASAALAMRLVRSMNLFRAFSQDAAEPPLGPIITPRYSAEGTTEKLAHSGTIFFDGFSDPFDSVGGWVDPERDERAFLDFEVKAGDVLEEVGVPLESGEVLKGLR